MQINKTKTYGYYLQLLGGNPDMNRLVCNRCFQSFKTQEQISLHLANVHQVTDNPDVFNQKVRILLYIEN